MINQLKIIESLDSPSTNIQLFNHHKASILILI